MRAGEGVRMIGALSAGWRRSSYDRGIECGVEKEFV